MTRIISIVGGLQPSTPTIGTATAGDTTASVAFTPSTYIGKGTITYTATSSPGGLTGTASSSPITVTGLTNGTAYTFTVTGTTNYGVTSIASGSSNSITPALGDTGFMFPLGSVTVPSSGAATITFSSIPATYTHLQIRCMTLFSVSDAGANIRFNSDTASNYSWHRILANGASVSAAAGANQTYGLVTIGAPSSTNIPGCSIIDILDDANTNKYKTVRDLAGTDANGNGYITLLSSNWRSTSAISSILIAPSSGVWNQYSQFALYGIKGA